MSAWEMQEPGWWTHERLGGIVRERDGRWHCYPSWCDVDLSQANFSTLKLAKAWMSKHKNRPIAGRPRK